MNEKVSEDDFWTWLTSAVGSLGKALTEKVLVAYFVAIDEATPAWAKATLATALVYVGFPLDAVPDVVPFAGFSDDATVLAAALAAVAVSVRARHLRSARSQMRSWGLKVEDVSEGLDGDDPIPA
jgi:uncharacterized membrane protein YkvA (DUF1232 family)